MSVQPRVLRHQDYKLIHVCYIRDACSHLFDWPMPGSDRQKFSMADSDRQSKIRLYSAIQTASPLPPLPLLK